MGWRRENKQKRREVCPNPSALLLHWGNRSEDEVIAIALWNNPILQADLSALGLARADVIEAGQLRNPNLTLIFPFSVRVLEAVAQWPFDAIWQRPRRVAAAKLEQDRLSQSLPTNALDLVRDVRLADLPERTHQGSFEAKWPTFKSLRAERHSTRKSFAAD